MNKLILALLIVSAFLFNQAATIAQTGKQAQPPSPPTQQASPFNLQDLLGMDLDDMFGEALKELESTRSIWEQYVDPALIDSSLSKMTDPMIGESFDALFKHLEEYLGQEEGIGTMFDQLLKNFNMPLNGLPFQLGPDILPEDLDEGGWQIIPNVPQPSPAPKQKDPGTQKKGVSVI